MKTYGVTEMSSNRQADDTDWSAGYLCHNLSRKIRDQNLGREAIGNIAPPSGIADDFETRGVVNAIPEYLKVDCAPTGT